MGRPGRFVWRDSVPGAILWKWEPPVPYVPHVARNSSLFLYSTKASAEKGEKWGGSGCLVGIRSQTNESRVHLYAVTNDHVRLGYPVIRAINAGGFVEIVERTPNDWTPHPNGDDLAVLYLGAVMWSDLPYMDATPGSSSLLTEEHITKYGGIGPGDECLMIGRYINHEGEQLDRPVVRFGNLAMCPPEIIRNEQRSFDQLSFLVDMRSVAGFSGSQVIVYYATPGQPPTFGEDDTPDGVHGQRQMMSNAWLLGIDWGHLPTWGDVYRDGQKIKGTRAKVDGGMTAVVPAWKLTELLFGPETDVPKDREKVEAALGNVSEFAAVAYVVTPEDEFENFEDLTRKLVKAPKPTDG